MFGGAPPGPCLSLWLRLVFQQPARVLTEKLVAGPSFCGRCALMCAPFNLSLEPNVNLNQRGTSPASKHQSGGNAGPPLQLCLVRGYGSIGSRAPSTTGCSCEVNLFISGVAETNVVRQIKIVETTRAIVQASPPSMP